jgi:hypothetical protein
LESLFSGRTALSVVYQSQLWCSLYRKAHHIFLFEAETITEFYKKYIIWDVGISVEQIAKIIKIIHRPCVIVEVSVLAPNEIE